MIHDVLSIFFMTFRFIMGDDFMLNEQSIGQLGREDRSSRRDNALDMMKGWLTLLMILSHLTYAVPLSGVGVREFNIYINLTTFSGFMLCFGYVCWHSYIESECDVTERLIKGASKSLLAYYICGIVLYIHGTVLDLGKVIFLQKIPTMTEFLFSFCLMYIAILLCRKQLVKLNLKNGIIVSTVLLVVTSIFPFEIIISPIMGSIVGTTTYACFPLIAYSIYFFTGNLLAKYRTVFNIWLFIITSTFTGIFFFSCSINGTLPRRFPPTVLWILGGSLFVYLYYCIFKLASLKGKEIKGLVFIGKHTLVFLVVSNLLVFSSWNHWGKIWQAVSINRSSLRYIFYIILTVIVSWSVIRVKEGTSKAIGTNFCKKLDLLLNGNRLEENRRNVRKTLIVMAIAVLLSYFLILQAYTMGKFDFIIHRGMLSSNNEIANQLNMSISYRNINYDEGTVTGKVTVTNNGEAIAHLSSGRYPINLGISVLDQKENIIEQDYLHMPIKSGVFKHEESIDIVLKLENLEADSILRFEIVQEGVLWVENTASYWEVR